MSTHQPRFTRNTLGQRNAPSTHVSNTSTKGSCSACKNGSPRDARPSTTSAGRVISLRVHRK